MNKVCKQEVYMHFFDVKPNETYSSGIEKTSHSNERKAKNTEAMNVCSFVHS